MRKLSFLITLLIAPYLYSQTPCSGGMAGSYPCNGITLQSYISAATMGAAEGQDSWGWTDTSGNGDEYAIVALDNGTAFVRITNPTNPQYLGRLNTQTGSSLWRDVKVYNNHAYIVSDGNGNHGMQIFDLRRLRGLTGNPVQTWVKADVDGLKTWGTGQGRGVAHNIIINEQSGYAYVVGTTGYANKGIVIFNLNTSLTNPPEVGKYETGGNCHDAQVMIYDGPDPDHQGKELFFGAFDGTDFLRILDVTNKTAITQISSMSYSNKYYTHQGWFTEDKRFFIFGDEVDEEYIGFNTRTMVYDLQDLDNPVLYHTHYGATKAIDHNGYVRGNRFYLANYAAGMRVMKIDGLYDPTPSITEVSYFDMFPNNNNAGFNGTWNVYPYFESGNLIATGFGNELVNGDGGLFILRDPNYDNIDPVAVCAPYTATLNKTTGTVTIDALDIDGGSTDNIGIIKRTLTGPTTFTCDDVGSTFNVTLTVEDDYGNKASCNTTVTVAAETTAFTSAAGGSWTNGAPDIGSNAKISFDYDTATSGSIDACTCEVDATKTLTVGPDDYLSITKDITVNGNLIVEHTGNVVQEDPNAVVTKNSGAVINVELTTPVLQTRDVMVMGSPMDAETRNGVFNSAFLVLEHIPANFIPHPGVLIGGANFADDNYDFWNSIPSGPINVGEGFIVRPQSGYTDPANHPYYMTYSQGTLNNGTVTRPIIFNGLATNPDGTPNILANPYASAMSGYDFINNNALVNEIYFWEHLTPPSSSIPGGGTLNFSMEDISMYNLSGGVKAPNDPGTSTTPNGVISTGQGFGIKAFGAGDVTFTNDMRLTSGNTTLRRPNENEIDRIWINVSNSEYEIGSTALVAFNPLATPQIDPGYDSNNIATVISIFSHLEDGTQQLGIQTREAFNTGIKIPMGFASQIHADITYSISIDAIEGVNISSANIFLVDNYENIIHDLSAGPYEFVSGIGTFDQRFTLMFEEEIVLGPVDQALKSIAIFPNPTKNNVSIYSPNATMTNIEVFDTRGRRVVDVLKEQDHVYILNLEKLETGIYFIKVNTEIGSITKKVIKE